MKYFKQIDGLRFFAILLVLIGHWFPKDHFLNKYTPNGMIGVTLFFVISGFLITNILIKEKQEGDPNGIVLKRFYYRRLLRIFPIYYLTLFLIEISGLFGYKDISIWNLFYLNNIYIFQINEWPGPFSHFWTLSVEEQFYLFWPLIILFFPINKIKNIAFLFIGVSIVIRFLLFSIYQTPFISLLTICQMDAFAIGAVLAIEKNFEIPQKYMVSKFIQKHFLTTIILILGLLIYLCFLKAGKSENIWSITFLILVIAIASSFLLNKSLEGFKGPLGKILENNVISYFGKVSYSIYLFHNFFPTLVALLIKKMGLESTLLYSNMYVFIAVNFILLGLLSSICWKYLEYPLLKLKNYKFQALSLHLTDTFRKNTDT